MIQHPPVVTCRNCKKPIIDQGTYGWWHVAGGPQCEPIRVATPGALCDHDGTLHDWKPAYTCPSHPTDRSRQSAVPGDDEPATSGSQRSSTESPTTEDAE